MPEKLVLRYPIERMEESQRLAAATAKFEAPDRVPVIFGVSTRYLLHARGVGFLEYFSDPATHLRHQLLNLQWKLENLPGDWLLNAGVHVAPDFQQGAQAGNFEVEVDWRDDVPPAVRPCVSSPEDVARLAEPLLDGGMFGRIVAWSEAMAAEAEHYEVTFNGEPVPIHVGFGQPGAPFPRALALAQESLFLWAGADPAALHLLMDLCTRSFIVCERWLRERQGRRLEHLGGGCDGGEMFSPAMFAEFVTPYHLRAYDAFPGQRALHMCGRIDHLLEHFATVWKLDNLTGFGSVTDQQKLAEALGGRCRMHGGVDCWTLERGTPAAVREASLQTLAALAPCGGYQLCDGYNLAPGTPLENLQAMVDASVEYGRPELRPRPTPTA